VTNILKLTIARPRPVFFYLCNYKGYYDAVHSGNYTAYYAATNPDKIGDYNDCLNFTNDSVASFPSGHASFSFTCMTFTVMVLQDMLKIKNGFTLWGMLTYSPLIVSAWIAVTRVHDFKHHEDDILAGAIIGAVCALLGFHFCSQAYTTNARVKEYESILQRRKPGLSNGEREDLKSFIGNA
jgi:phosphatidate phosphatase